MAPEPEQKQEEVLRLFQQVLHLWQSPSSWLEIELTLPQIRILIAIAEQEPVTVKHLAQRLEISHVTVIRLLEHLERAELIQREEDTRDRRRRPIHLTAKGHHVFEAVSFRKRALTAWLQTLDQHDLETVHSCLTTLIDLASTQNVS